MDTKGKVLVDGKWISMEEFKKRTKKLDTSRNYDKADKDFDNLGNCTEECESCKL